MNIRIHERQLQRLLEKYQENSKSVRHIDDLGTLSKTKINNKFNSLLFDNEMNIENYNDIAYKKYDNSKIFIYLYNNKKIVFYLSLLNNDFGYSIEGVASHLSVSGKGLAQKVYLRIVEMMQEPLFSDLKQTYSSRYGIWYKLYNKYPNRIGCVKNSTKHKVEMVNDEMICDGDNVYSTSSEENEIRLILYP